ncbi:hypothetical protein BGZ98_004380, partial [Dissophora globulifera]
NRFAIPFEGDSSHPTELLKRLALFQPGEKGVEVMAQEFEAKWWPLATNLWMRYSAYKSPTTGDSWIVYVCRLSKPFKSSTRAADVPIEKRRNTSVRDPIPCTARIKVSTFLSKGTIRVAAFPSCTEHCHSLEDCDKIKRPEVVRSLIRLEAAKPY